MSSNAVNGTLFDLPVKDADTWLTPEWLYRPLGEFELDPCAAEQFPERIAPNGFTVREDGLSRMWEGRVFLNPPFSQLGTWLHRMVDHGNGIALVPACTETELWHTYVWSCASAVLLLRGRTRFVLPDGITSGGRPRFSIALVAYGHYNRAALSKAGIPGVFLPGWVA